MKIFVSAALSTVIRALLSGVAPILLALYWAKYQSEEVSLAGLDLNSTWVRNCHHNVLIFNRTPKTGSQTVWALIDRLGKRNNFKTFTKIKVSKYRKRLAKQTTVYTQYGL